MKSSSVSTVVLAGLIIAGCSANHAEPAKKDEVKTVTSVSLQHFDSAQEIKYPWGTIRWLMNSKLDAGSGQTFGIVEIQAGQKNSLHMHPNCEELLYVLSGSCEHRVGDKKVIIKAGDLVRIPAGTPHQATVIGNEPLRAVISYSSGDRQVVDLAAGKE